MECDQRFAKGFCRCLRAGLPAALVAVNAKAEAVAPKVHQILARLFDKSAGGRVQAGEPQGVIVRLIPAVFAVGKDGHAKVAVATCQIRPLLGRHFIQLFVIISSVDYTQSQVVVRAVCGGNKGKFSLEHRTAAAPIHSVLHPNTAAAGIQADHLFHFRHAQLTADFNSRLGGATLQQLKLRCVGIEIRRFINIGLAHFPRRVV